MARVRRVVAEKVQTHSQAQVNEPLVKVSHICEIHYAEEVPNHSFGTKLEMTAETMSASAIVPASVAVELAKDLAKEIEYESSNPCLSYDCKNAKCARWIGKLNELKEEYKELQNAEQNFEVALDTDDWYGSLIDWALQYTKQNGLVDDHNEIAKRVFE